MQKDDARDLPADDVEELYAVLGGLLLRTLPDLLHIPVEDAQNAVYETFLGFVTVRPREPSAWIVAAAMEKARPARIPAGVPFLPLPDALPSERSTLDRAMASLSAREREAVRMALVERMPLAEIAAALEVTPRYAKKLVQRATAKLRKYAEEL